MSSLFAVPTARAAAVTTKPAPIAASRAVGMRNAGMVGIENQLRAVSSEVVLELASVLAGIGAAIGVPLFKSLAGLVERGEVGMAAAGVRRGDADLVGLAARAVVSTCLVGSDVAVSWSPEIAICTFEITATSAINLMYLFIVLTLFYRGIKI
jgi:hypothetical protein